MAARRSGSRAQLYLLADTTFNSLAVDEVAAEHASAQCVVHYGHASLSPVNRLPAFFVFPALPVDEDALCEHVAGMMSSCDRLVLVLLDLAYVHCRQRLVDRLQVSGVQGLGWWE